jgi:2-keto-4-pentenoate hydratase/2-oxohepta-3-ene-1,7-dioic acid hydratase in catechol pathway
MTGEGIIDLGSALRERYADLRSIIGACELAVIIGRRGRHIPRAAAMSYVVGYSGYNDASVRDFQRHSTQFTAGKNFPATGGVGPCLVTPDEVGDAHALPFRTLLNEEVIQSANTSQLIFDIPTLIAYLFTFTELSSGDVIATRTPGGVGFKRDLQVFMNPGDEIVVEISRTGSLVNHVVSESR